MVISRINGDYYPILMVYRYITTISNISCKSHFQISSGDFMGFNGILATSDHPFSGEIAATSGGAVGFCPSGVTLQHGGIPKWMGVYWKKKQTNMNDLGKGSIFGNLFLVYVNITYT
jgi:hypothetical protein